MAATTEIATAPSDASSRGKRRLTIFTVLAVATVGAMASYSLGATNGSGVESIALKERQEVASVTDINAVDPSSSKVGRSSRRRLSALERLLENEPETEDDEVTKEEALIEKIAKKLEPVSLRFFGDENEEEADLEVGQITTGQRKMVPHQFLHLHHMKTGGTSIDRLLRCSMDRLKKEAKYNVPYYSIHECSRSRFASCLTDPENKCRTYMEEASVMSYCAALKYLDEFGWWHNNNEENKVKAFTVLRNPVDRVWSMYRFQTKNCYKCIPLKEIYQKIESGEDFGDQSIDKLCLDQLQNHEVNNLLSTEWPLEVSELDPEKNDEHSDIAAEMAQEAIDNMKGFFTVIGITEELEETAKILGTAFPWMNLDPMEAHNTTSQCALPHANASPKNNRCGEGNTHWDLPSQPDQETYDLIVKHNSLDIELYESAVAYFDLQQRALSSTE